MTRGFSFFKKIIGLCLLVSTGSLFGQKSDSLKKIITTADNRDLTFTGTKINTDTDVDSTGKLILGGYVSAYYAYYTDTAGPNNYQKFPTISPQSDAFGLNIVQLSAKYSSSRFRGNFTLHYGDIPQSAWSPQFNNIQEANVALKICKPVWIEAGFFRTHLGLESIQPRENIASSMASTTYFEPYYLSGAKLTYRLNGKLTLQAGVFNSFNGFVENNKNKAVCGSILYEPNKNLSITFNSITSDDSLPKASRTRVYNNIFAVYRSKKFHVGAELNYGMQQHSDLETGTHTAYMYSGLIAAKYKMHKYVSVYTRFEFFEDSDEILTGPVINDLHKFVGLNILGGTGGVELKVIANSYFRVEYRYLQTNSSEKVFYYNSESRDYRHEFQTTLGVWF